MTLTLDQVKGLGGSGKVVTDRGDKVGNIGQIYLDDQTGEPEWVTVKTGLFGSAESFAPLQGARIDGDNIVVNYDKDTVKAAPRVDADGSLSPEEEQSLYRHYGLSSTTGTADSSNRDNASGWNGVGDVPSDLDDPSEVGDHRPDISDQTVGYDRSGPTTDTAMTRSEERLHVGTRTRESGRVRLRKYVVTEQVSQTVPVRKEKVRLEREPITDANRGAAMSGPAISEEEHEIVLHDEVAVTEKEAVAVERVRLDKATVTEQQTISADVRKEQIELDEPQGGTNRR